MNTLSSIITVAAISAAFITCGNSSAHAQSNLSYLPVSQANWGRSGVNQELTLSWYKKGWYNAGDTLSYNFSHPTYVERVLVSAEGHRNFAGATVYADGEQVAFLGVPGTDPDYPVVVRKKITSLIIKFQGTIKITDMRIYGAQTMTNPYDMINGDPNTTQGLAEMALGVVAVLQEVESEANFTTYLLPIRKAALKMAASAGGRPTLSNKTNARVVALVNAIVAAEGHLDFLADRSYFTNAIETLLFVKERLQSMYEM